MLFELQFFAALLLSFIPVIVMVFDYFNSVSKEIEKQGHELEEVTGQLDESEKQCQRLQRELENVEDIHRKVR
jgi:uncharacterized protein YoxC